MKNALRFFAIGLILAIASPAWATTDPYLKVTVTGTVQTQIVLGLGEGRIRTKPLNNKRIFQEYAVLPQDYELVLDTNMAALVLLPRHTSANLPTITILKTGSYGLLVDTKVRAERFQSDIVAGNSTNLFKDVAGEIDGAIFYKGSFASPTVTKYVFSVTARGTDPVGGITTYALLKFKVVAQGGFAQQP